MFRNPGNGHPPAGALIDRAGLKGFRIGDTAVSDVHANFLVNVGDGSSEDMRELIERVKGKVRELYEVELVEEVRYIPHKL